MLMGSHVSLVQLTWKQGLLMSPWNTNRLLGNWSPVHSTNYLVKNMEIKIASINCNSFRCEIKQASILSFLNANNVNIVCLQETFMDSMHYKKAIKDKWSCEVFMSPAPQNNSCGVAILVKQNLNLNILKIFNDSLHII